MRGGQEISLLDVCRGLAGKGHQVTLAYVTPGDFEDEYRRICHRMVQVRTYSIDRSRTLVSLRDFLGSLWAVRGEHPDVVYANQYQDSLFAGIARRLHRAPFVCHLRLPPPDVMCTQFRLGMSQATRLVAISEQTKRDWVACGYRAAGNRRRAQRDRSGSVCPSDRPVGASSGAGRAGRRSAGGVRGSAPPGQGRRDTARRLQPDRTKAAKPSRGGRSRGRHARFRRPRPRLSWRTARPGGTSGDCPGNHVDRASARHRRSVQRKRCDDPAEPLVRAVRPRRHRVDGVRDAGRRQPGRRHLGDPDRRIRGMDW